MRVNAVYARGAPTLVRTIQENFNLPISRFAIENPERFQAIASAVVGAEVCFPQHYATRSPALPNPSVATCSIRYR